MFLTFLVTLIDFGIDMFDINARAIFLILKCMGTGAKRTSNFKMLWPKKRFVRISMEAFIAKF